MDVLRTNRSVKEKPHSCGGEVISAYQIGRDTGRRGVGTHQLERGGWLEGGTKASWG